MLDRREELSAFKTEINLAGYALAAGYMLDRKASSRSSAVLRHPDGDKIVVSLDQDGHWVYFSVRDDRDCGSIIDFVQRRHSLSLGEVRKELRPWLNGPVNAGFTPGAVTSAPVLEPVAKDLLRVRAKFEGMQEVAGHHPYLEAERRIPAAILADPQFSGCIRNDDRGNAVFPHWNESGLSGFEMKNHYFTGFAPGGEKGLWESNATKRDNVLVIVESAIDGLSHFAIRRPPGSRYVSIAGTLNQNQPHLLRLAVGKMQGGAQVVMALDNDTGGDRLGSGIRECLRPLGVEIVEDRPASRGADWNDVLRAGGQETRDSGLSKAPTCATDST